MNVPALRGDQMLGDVLHRVFRRVARRPGPVLGTAATLGLAIGITTAIFTLLDALILRPIPFRAPEALATIWMRGPHGGSLTVSGRVLRAWRDSDAFAAVEGALPGIALIEHGDGVVARGFAQVTPGMFDLLGSVTPVTGRLFYPTEGDAGATDRVLLSEELWRTLYARDGGLLNRRITINGESLLVVGILPAEFRFPSWNTMVWRPAHFSGAADRPFAYVRFSDARPRPDSLRVATEAARAVDGALIELQARERPLTTTVLDPYFQRAVPLFAGGALVVFLLLAANASSLFLATVIGRRDEYRKCTALGASRGRLMGEVAVEACAIGGLALVIGAALAWALVSAAHAVVPQALVVRTLNPLNLDLRALAVAAASAIAATVLAGLLPASAGTRIDARHSLRLDEVAGTPTRVARGVTRAMLVGEIMLACTLLVGATLLLRSFVGLTRAERGIDPGGVMTATIGLPKAAFGDLASRAAIARTIEEQVRQLPAVTHVAWSHGLPPDRANFSEGSWRSDVPGAAPLEMTVDHYSVGADFFELYRIPLLSGRTFRDGDTNQHVVVGEALARALWPGLMPVGRVFTWDNKQFEVIGVVREIRYPSLDRTLDRLEFYRRFAGVGQNAMLSIRCVATCPNPAQIHSRLLKTHPSVNVVEVREMQEAYAEQLSRPRAAAAFAGAFAAIAVLAAAGGLFGVLSYFVGRRRREFGIRLALGASHGQIRGLVVREAVAVSVIGIGCGALLALSFAHALSALQYGVTVNDARGWATVVAVLGGAIVAACWRPTRQATRVDLVRLLKDD